MPEGRQEELIHELAKHWNAGDLDTYATLFHPDVVFLSSDNWPEPGRREGRDSLRAFWHEFRAVWDDVQLGVDEVHHGEGALAARCHWITRGRVSGMEGTMDFSITLWIRDGQIVRGQFFEELPEALTAAGIG